MLFIALSYLLCNRIKSQWDLAPDLSGFGFLRMVTSMVPITRSLAYQICFLNDVHFLSQTMLNNVIKVQGIMSVTCLKEKERNKWIIKCEDLTSSHQLVPNPVFDVSLKELFLGTIIQ